MLASVCRRAVPRAFPRQSLLCAHRFHPCSTPLALRFSTSPIHYQHGVSAKEQRRKDWMVVRKLIGNVWPKHDWNTRFRVVLGFALLVSGKVPFVSVAS